MRITRSFGLMLSMSLAIAGCGAPAVTLATSGTAPQPSAAADAQKPSLAAPPTVFPNNGAAVQPSIRTTTVSPGLENGSVTPSRASQATTSPTFDSPDDVAIESLDAIAKLDATANMRDLVGGLESEAVSAPSTVIAPVELPEALTYAALTDAHGQALSAIAAYQAPVYLTPLNFPILLQGSPATAMPAFTPIGLDMNTLPSDAFVELGRLKRLREAKRTWLSWLFGYTFKEITAETARARLVAGETIYLGPDGSRWHRDRAFKAITNAQTLNDMLPLLREAQQTELQRENRTANINARMNQLPPFNQVFNIQNLLLLDAIVQEYTYNGSSVRRGAIAAANFYTLPVVRRALATWWEDRPTTTPAAYRRQVVAILAEQFRVLRSNYTTNYATNPKSYEITQQIPGLRDPRPTDGSDTRMRDADRTYNQDALNQLAASMPNILDAVVYP